MPDDESNQAAVANVETAAEVLQHIRAHIGPVDSVFHEIGAGRIAIDIHHVPPGEGRQSHTLVTSGMSDQRMPEGGGVRYGELVMRLPPDWALDEEALEDDSRAWPLALLRALGRLPFATGCAFDFGLYLDDSGLPFSMARDTGFSGVMLAPPVTVKDSFWCLEAAGGKIIDFLGVVMLFPQELALAREQGVVALARALDRLSVNELVQVGRRLAV